MFDAKYRDTTAARLAAAKLCVSPVERGEQKIAASLGLVRRWDFSPAEFINEVAGRKGFTSVLVKKGLLHEHPVPGAGFGVPAKIFTLTPSAVELVESITTPIGSYSDKIPFHQLRHDLAVQRFTLLMMEKGGFTGYLTPSEFAQRSQTATKQPDAVWIKDGTHTSFELELTTKRGHEFDRTVHAMIQQLVKREFQNIIIASHSRAILNQYKVAFLPGSNLQLWSKSASRQWVRSGKLVVPDVTQFVIFKEVKLSLS